MSGKCWNGVLNISKVDNQVRRELVDLSNNKSIFSYLHTDRTDSNDRFYLFRAGYGYQK